MSQAQDVDVEASSRFVYFACVFGRASRFLRGIHDCTVLYTTIINLSLLSRLTYSNALFLESTAIEGWAEGAKPRQSTLVLYLPIMIEQV